MPWWADLLQGQEQAPALPPQRPVWSAEARESHRSLFTAGRSASFYPLTTFYGRLGERLEQAKRHGEPLAVVVLQLPVRGSQGWTRQRQRELENALRLSVRRGDLPARLSPTTLAVALPQTGANAGVVALRLQRVLTRLAEGRVAAGTACHPADGSTARELLQVATWRSLTALPGSQPDPELTQLLGPLRPGRAERSSPSR
jgi:hypothetical protein